MKTRKNLYQFVTKAKLQQLLGISERLFNEYLDTNRPIVGMYPIYRWGILKDTNSRFKAFIIPRCVYRSMISYYNTERALSEHFNSNPKKERSLKVVGLL